MRWKALGFSMCSVLALSACATGQGNQTTQLKPIEELQTLEFTKVYHDQPPQGIESLQNYHYLVMRRTHFPKVDIEQGKSGFAKMLQNLRSTFVTDNRHVVMEVGAELKSGAVTKGADMVALTLDPTSGTIQNSVQYNERVLPAVRLTDYVSSFRVKVQFADIGHEQLNNVGKLVAYGAEFASFALPFAGINQNISKGRVERGLKKIPGANLNSSLSASIAFNLPQDLSNTKYLIAYSSADRKAFKNMTEVRAEALANAPSDDVPPFVMFEILSLSTLYPQPKAALSYSSDVYNSIKTSLFGLDSAQRTDQRQFLGEVSAYCRTLNTVLGEELGLNDRDVKNIIHAALAKKGITRSNGSLTRVEKNCNLDQRAEQNLIDWSNPQDCSPKNAPCRVVMELMTGNYKYQTEQDNIRVIGCGDDVDVTIPATSVNAWCKIGRKFGGYSDQIKSIDSSIYANLDTSYGKPNARLLISFKEYYSCKDWGAIDVCKIHSIQVDRTAATLAAIDRDF